MPVLPRFWSGSWLLPTLPILGKIRFQASCLLVIDFPQDFRSIPNEGSNDFLTAPALINSTENDGNQTTTSSYFNTTIFNNDWSIQNDPEEPDADVPSINSAQNVFIAKQIYDNSSEGTYLALRASRLPGFASIAEIDSNEKNLLHSSIRARMRIIPTYSNASQTVEEPDIDTFGGVNTSHPVAPGAVLGFFTFESNTQESDIEILTSDPTTNIRFSNQPDWDSKTGNSVPGASSDVAMPNGIVWTDWHDYRLDWYHGVSRWYIDGELVLEKTINVPTKPSGLILNLWSDGGEWSGNMSVGAEVVAGFEWIEMAFNISGNINGPSKRHTHQTVCDIGCNVDGVQDIGFPMMAFNVTGDNGARSVIAGGTVTMLATLWAVLVAGSALWASV